MPSLIVKQLSWFKTNPQVRKYFDETDLRRLGESLKVKQLQPVLAQPDGTLIAGERRYRAALLVGLATLEVKIADEPLNAAQVKLWQITENMQRADLSAFEKWQGCAELMCMNPAWQLKDLAGHLHLDPSMVTRLLSPSKCIAAAREALAAGKIGISDCYAISKLPEAEQEGLLALKLNGASRDAIERAGRKSRNNDTPAVKVSKVKCVLPSGVNVVVSGEGVSLDESIEALAEAMREMKRARELGYTARTFAAAMKDKARKG
jgi:ParB family transcriptional regulator, chromosome partitioning protein